MILARSAKSTCWWHVLCSHHGESMGAQWHSICAIICRHLGNLCHRIMAAFKHVYHLSSVGCHRAVVMYHFMFTTELNRALEPLIQAILCSRVHLRSGRTCASDRFSSDLLSAKSGHRRFYFFSWISFHLDNLRFFYRSIFSWGNSLGNYIVIRYEFHELVTEKFAFEKNFSIWLLQKPQLLYCVARMDRVLNLGTSLTAKETIYVLDNLMHAHVKLVIIAKNTFCAKIRRNRDVARELFTNILTSILFLKNRFVGILYQRPILIELS